MLFSASTEWRVVLCARVQIIYSTAMYFLIMYLIPLILLVILNYQLMTTLRRTRRKRDSWRSTRRNEDQAEQTSRSEDEIELVPALSTKSVPRQVKYVLCALRDITQDNSQSRCMRRRTKAFIRGRESGLARSKNRTNATKTIKLRGL